MHAATLAAWHQFSEPLEGRVHSLYVDVKGLVTTGVGNLIDSMAPALQLPWRRVSDVAQLIATDDDPLASAADIAAAWNGLKAQRDKFAKLHWKYAAKLNNLRLTDGAVDALVERVLRGNVATLRRTFVNWDALPADAQLGILSMAWAVGTGFPKIFGNFTRAALAGDWTGAAASCKIRDGLDTPSKADDNPGIVPRNAANRLCFANAALVLKGGFDIDRLYWPNVVPPGSKATELMADAKEAIEARDVFDAAMKKFTETEFARVRLGFGAAALEEYEKAEET